MRYGQHFKDMMYLDNHKHNQVAAIENYALVLYPGTCAPSLEVDPVSMFRCSTTCNQDFLAPHWVVPT